ncbi:hypothetical protein [Cellulomonas cellasea]|uniref:Uncharacterized protein n=1 Tax=Cellulomonas cellasea TaxID=43670 RepID=A0A7W4UF67_9CELL|nr:hypothetical protein [Cellulomonas cellasea]MBB2923046.1 hypothetical protein [Cellulomonas cellasea]
MDQPTALRRTYRPAARPTVHPGRRVVTALALVAVLAGCVPSPTSPREGDPVPGAAPERFTIVPDDYHVPYAGTAEDGRRFFLSVELFSPEPGGPSYVGLFLWHADGTFDEVRVDAVTRPDGVPPSQAVPAGADDLVQARLAELGDYVLEPVDVEPFLEEVDGIEFGWRFQEYDGTAMLNIEPGDFIAYYAPWDGLEYDT